MSHRVRIGLIASIAAAATVLAACSSAPAASSSSSSSPSSSSSSHAPSSAPSSSSSSQAPSSAPSSSGLSSAPSSAASSSSAPDTGAITPAGTFLPCVVSDTAGFNDHSFNEQSFDAVKTIATRAGVKFKSAESKTAADYVPNVNQLVAAGCTEVVASGFNLVAAIKAAATANPKVDFVMVDDNSITLPNVKDVVFATNQAAFLGGYAAAAYSKTGVVATWGGQEIPPVTIYMDGFWDGVQYYNQQNGKSVKVLGWNETTQKGTFVGNFTDQNSAKTITTNFLNQKADVVMPVAGSLYEGGGAAIRSQKSDAVLMGVDADVFQTDTSGYQNLMLVSVLKNIDVTVSAVLTGAAQGKFDNTQFIGTLTNNGVGLSPFHDFASKVPSTLSGEITTLISGIESGSIKAPSPAEPKA